MSLQQYEYMILMDMLFNTDAICTGQDATEQTAKLVSGPETSTYWAQVVKIQGGIPASWATERASPKSASLTWHSLFRSRLLGCRQSHIGANQQ